MEEGVRKRTQDGDGEGYTLQNSTKLAKLESHGNESELPGGKDATYNPYLAHRNTLPPLIPGKITVEQAMQYEDSKENFLNGKPYSERYRDLLKKRRELPVSKHRGVFLDIVRKNQVVVVVGEAGSGKTTQWVHQI